jgi:hypothetical protein
MDRITDTPDLRKYGAVPSPCSRRRRSLASFLFPHWAHFTLVPGTFRGLEPKREKERETEKSALDSAH